MTCDTKVRQGASSMTAELYESLWLSWVPRSQGCDWAGQPGIGSKSGEIPPDLKGFRRENCSPGAGPEPIETFRAEF
jgi:hypothetical protein